MSEKPKASDEIETAAASKDDSLASVGERNEDTHDDGRYPSGLKVILITIGLCLAIFVVALDNTIISTAIPHIETQFHSLGDVGWYGSAYLLTTTSLMPFFGKIITYFSVKWVWLASLVIFEVGSIVCAASTSSVMFIFGRAVAGVGAAALFSGGMTIIALSVPLRKRAIYLAAVSSMFGIASIVGPILGGVFTTQLSWRWCFWINLPFGGAACLAVLFFYSDPPNRNPGLTVKQKLRQIDFLGSAVLMAAIVCLVLALQWGGSEYPWSDSRVWGCLLGFTLLLIIFCVLQVWLGDRATMPPRIVCRQRTVLSCALLSLFLAMALYTHLYYLPFYFQAVKGVSAESSGIHCVAYLISMTVGSIIVGGVITTFGYYVPPLFFGLVIYAVGAGLLYTLQVTTPSGLWIGYQILAGFGMGCCVQIPFMAVQAVLDEKDVAIGNSVAIFFNTLGGSIAVSAANNIFVNTLVSQIHRRAPSVNAETVVQAGATNVRKIITNPQHLLEVLEAYDKAIVTAFILAIVCAGCAFLSGFLIEWRNIKEPAKGAHLEKDVKEHE